MTERGALDADRGAPVAPAIEEGGDHLLVADECRRGQEALRAALLLERAVRGEGVQVPDSKWGQATVRLTRCGSCWDESDVTVDPGFQKELNLSAGRYYVTLIKELETSGNMRFSLDRVGL